MSTEFNGDNKKLIASINALLALDAKGCLAPHGIGEHARVLLQTCEARLPEQNYPSEAELIASGLGYPIGKEDAVKLHYAGYRSEVITVLEAWEAIGHDIHINPDKQELMESLRNMAAICAAHGFDMPAEQHQGEPVARGLREEFDTLLDALQLAGHEKEFNEAIGRYKYNQPAFELFQRLATGADAGEVEQLVAANTEYARRHLEQQAEVERLRSIERSYDLREELLTQVKGERDRMITRTCELSDQLAERDALLHDCAGGMPPWETVLKIKALLSSSTEPSAPACGKCGSLNVDACKTDGCWFEQGQSAPAERDERAEFEVCIRREWPMAPISRKRDLLPKDDPCYGDYCDEPLQRAWVGWQMRAALKRKPA